MNYLQESIVTIALMSVVGFFLTSFIMKLGVVAHPNERSSHTASTPTAGGIAIIATMILTAFVIHSEIEAFLNLRLFGIILAALCCGVVGFCDDVYEIKPAVRLLVTLILSLGVFLYALQNVSYLSPWLYVLILLNLGFMNAYNFFDGLNGLAASTLFIGLIFILRVFPENALPLLSLLPGLIGFLVWNMRGRIFMGDTGALFLGFITPLLILFDRSEHVLLLILILGHFFFPMLSDISLTIIRRVIQKKSIIKPHRDFYFLRLKDRGFSHLGVTTIYAGFALIQGGVSLLFNLLEPQALILVYILNFLFYGMVMLGIHRITAISDFDMKR